MRQLEICWDRKTKRQKGRKIRGRKDDEKDLEDIQNTSIQWTHKIEEGGRGSVIKIFWSIELSYLSPVLQSSLDDLVCQRMDRTETLKIFTRILPLEIEIWGSDSAIRAENNWLVTTPVSEWVNEWQGNPIIVPGSDKNESALLFHMLELFRSLRKQFKVF